MTVSKEKAREAFDEVARLVGVSVPALRAIGQFIEQSQDSGHVAAPTDKVLLYVKSYLAEREDWPGTEDLIGDIDFAIAAAPAPTQHWPILLAILRPAIATGEQAVIQHAQRLVEVLTGDERAALVKLLECPRPTEPPARVVHGSAPTPQPELTDERLKFEATMMAKYPGVHLQRSPGGYTDHRATIAWDAWQVRSLLGAAPTQPDENEDERVHLAVIAEREACADVAMSMSEAVIRKLIDVRDAQGNSVDSPYMLGLYNGLELAVAIAEDRDPQYRELPATQAPQQPAMRYDVLYEIAATFSLDYNAVCKVAHSLSGVAPASTQQPLDMVLHCPKCGVQHIDAPEPYLGEYLPEPAYESEWTNPPHRSHLCHGCGHIWRPADVPTNGVAAVKTKGKADSPLSGAAPTPQPDKENSNA